jgi:hypothetical protein
MIKNIYEILDEVAKAPDDESRKAVLYYNQNHALLMVLRAAFHPDIRFVIKTIPKYTPADSPIGMGQTSLHMDINKIYLFEENNPRVSPNLTLERKEQLLMQILEGLEAREAEVLCNTLLKDLKVPGLTKELVLEVFPELLK